MSKTTIFVGFFMTIVSFLQAYRYWGENMALSYFFLIGGIVLVGLDFRVILKRIASEGKNT
ncbi:hypothetical protein IMZ31_05645 [Pontibacillus sp. ALD_SL1]|uniref:hypothetical protein n=1 Tax=Pontibacillus sp. ALD_SL1 TaxID=2777185 RepID=UPI001A96A29C|nr:hypothetical protein [Pontibacillus sp. ALD_SL1]QST01050.1 hypothetical protein IMZ31_05645 [Pontibacillus sp. ALD_SL1]